MERVGHLFLVHAGDEQAVGLDHHLGIRCLHREDDLVVGVARGDAEELEGALDHAERRVAVAVHDAIAERAVIGADAHRAAELFAADHERGKRIVEAGEFGVVVGVGVFADGEFFLVGVVAGIDADFFDVLDGFHRGAREEMDVGDDRDVGEAGGGELGADVAQAAGGGDVGRGDADDLAADLGEGDGLLDGGGDVLGVARRHRLDADGIGAADADRCRRELRAYGGGWFENGKRSRATWRERKTEGAKRAGSGVIESRLSLRSAVMDSELTWPGAVDSARLVLTSRTMRRTSKEAHVKNHGEQENHEHALGAHDEVHGEGATTEFADGGKEHLATIEHGNRAGG